MAKRKIPPPPASLNPPARDRWVAVAPMLVARGDVDLATLETYCQLWARWRQAEAGIAQTGQLVKKGGGVGASPLISISNQAGTQVRALEKTLGLVVADASSEPPASARTSLRAFARLIGVDEKAVRKAIESGRLLSVHRDGRKVFITDVRKARDEWTANVAKPTKAPGEQSLVDVQRLVATERARALQITNDRRLGTLIDANDAAKDAFEAARVIRESILNIPARISAELAAETDPAKVFTRLELELRRALEAASAALVS